MMEIVRGFLRVLLILWITVGAFQNTGKLVFFIIDPENSNTNAVQELTVDIVSQATELDVSVVVYNTSTEWLAGGAWTYFPLLNKLSSEHGDNGNWVMFISSEVQVRMAKLLQVLHARDSSQLVFLGRGLQDQEETIIHHFARVDATQPFLYPDVRTGVVLSSPLITRLAKKWEESRPKPGSEINIDASYEFASFVKSAAAVNLSSDTAFCVEDGTHCATLYSPATKCGKAVDVDRIHFAIKSWEQNHKNRLPVLYNTWLKDATNYAIYSDVQDTSYGTVTLGVANTERGHCGKTLAIMHHVGHMDGVHWLFIADDDTLINIDELSELLACHDYTQPVALGERYGYAAALPHGYDYITGGGGMVFSQTLVQKLISPNVCVCPSNDTPDDMFLGICLRSLDVPITHSSSFHQARPMDYSAGRLEGERLVSFHKFWMIDPYEVFNHWLQSPSTKPSTHQDEL